MAHDVFISYSSKDKAAGLAVCEALEGHGVRCWMAPRDIVAGEGWAKSILGAISRSRVMVLLLTTEANVSPQVEREVERAVHKRVPIVPVRIEDVMPGEALEYFLSAPHWFDAFSPPLEQHMDRLARAVQTVLDSRSTAKVVAVEDMPPPVEDEELQVGPPELQTVAEIVTGTLAAREREEIVPPQEETAPQQEETVPEQEETVQEEEQGGVESEAELPAETTDMDVSAALADRGRARKVILAAVLSSVAAVVIVIATAASLGLVGALVWPA